MQLSFLRSWWWKGTNKRDNLYQSCKLLRRVSEKRVYTYSVRKCHYFLPMSDNEEISEYLELNAKLMRRLGSNCEKQRFQARLGTSEHLLIISATVIRQENKQAARSPSLSLAVTLMRFFAGIFASRSQQIPPKTSNFRRCLAFPWEPRRRIRADTMTTLPRSETASSQTSQKTDP